MINNSYSNIINGFLKAIKENGYDSYDPYDLWSIKYGILARKIYYRNRVLSLPLITPILLADTYFPQIRKLFIKKKKYPIADAHFILGYINLYEITENAEYLSEAIRVSENLLKSSVNGFSGHCWGYPFDWQNSKGLWKKGTPFITTTPYCFEAFLRLFDFTKEQKYLDIAYSISLFAYNDIKFSEMNDGTLASSYSPFDNSKVINASAYNGLLLSESYKRFKDEHYRKRAEKLIQFVIKSQNEDGSWYYALDEPNDNFIDNIHTCFILKNLIKANYYFRNDDFEKAIDNGYKYYLKSLIDTKGYPKSFAKLHRMNLIKTDLYDYAEGIILGLLMTEKNNEAKVLVEKLMDIISANYVSNQGTFTSKVNNLGFKINIPYLRWPQSQIFYAFTSYLKFNLINFTER